MKSKTLSRMEVLLIFSLPKARWGRWLHHGLSPWILPFLGPRGIIDWRMKGFLHMMSCSHCAPSVDRSNSFQRGCILSVELCKDFVPSSWNFYDSFVCI